MKDIKIGAIISLLINIIFGALIFAWVCTNLDSSLATTAGVLLLGLGTFFAVTFPRLIERA